MTLLEDYPLHINIIHRQRHLIHLNALGMLL